MRWRTPISRDSNGVRRPSGEYESFEQQVAQSRRGLLDAEFRLMDFSSDQGVVSGRLRSATWYCRLS